MQDKEQEHGPGTASADRGGGTRSGWFVALPAITLVIGLVLGGLIAGAAIDGSPAEDDGAQNPTSTDTPTAGSDDAESSGDVEIVVPEECLDAADTVEEATRVLRDGVGAIEDFDREPLLEALNRLEDLEAQAREQADLCSEVEVDGPQ